MTLPSRQKPCKTPTAPSRLWRGAIWRRMGVCKGWFQTLALFGKKYKIKTMKQLKRITFDPAVMGGKPCIRGLRVTVGTIVGLIASGHSKEEILKLYPYLEPGDIDEALSYAAWRVEEIE